MKFKFSKFLLAGMAIGVALLAVAPRASAQVDPTRLLNITNIVQLVGTNTVTNFTTVSLPQTTGFAVSWTFNLTAAGVSNVWVKGLPSVDGTNFDTVPLFVLGATGAGTTDVFARTNIPLTSYQGYRKLQLQFHNANSQNITNKTFVIGRAN